MEEICYLFSQLHYREQIQVMRAFPCLVKVDFLTELPLLAIERILSYLSVRDAVRASMVCWRWRKNLMNCRKYWMAVCTCAGLSDAYVSSWIVEKDSSLVELAITVFRHVSKVKSLLSLSDDINILQQGNCLIWKVLVNLHLYFSMSSHGKAIMYEQFQNGTYRSKFSYATNVISPVLASQQFEQDFRVSWVCVYRNSLIIVTNDAEWIKIENGSTKQTWIDSEVVSSLQTMFGVCSSCGLLIQVCRNDRFNNRLNWTVVCVALIETDDQAHRVSSAIDLSSVDMHLRENDAIFLQSVALVPASPEICSFSSCHFLLVQFNSCVIMYSVTCDYKAMSSLKLVQQRVFYMIDIPCINSLVDLTNRRNTFRISGTNNTLALINRFKLFVWDIRSNKSASCFDLLSLFRTNCDPLLMAVGDIYCVVECRLNRVVNVVSVLTGDIVYSITVPVCKNPREEMHLCLMQHDWMNSFYFKF